MYSYKSYTDCMHQLKHYFVAGFSKVMDLGNFNQIDYPKCMTDEEARAFDKNALREDFVIVGKDIGKALNSYGKTHKI